MATGRITKRSVDAQEPGDHDKLLWDSEILGFGLKVTPTGTRTYLTQYRIGGRKGRTRRVTIGQHGRPWTDPRTGETKSLTPEVARKEAKRLLGLVTAGEDPAESRTRARQAITVADLCDLYLSEGVAQKKAGTVARDKRRIELHVKPLIGGRRARDITQDDVDVFINAVAKRFGKGAASRTVGMLGGIFTFAVKKNKATLCARNPVHGVKRFADHKVERFLSPAELARLGETLVTAGRCPYLC